MQIEVNEIEPCKLSVHYIADAEEILNKRGEVLNAFKKAPVPGFRQGKASLDAIKIHYRSQIDEALKRALAEDAYHNTLFEKKIKPHGPPRFNAILMADGKFTCDFEMLTKPNFELSDFANMEIPKPHEPETVAEVTEKMLQELRVRFGEAVPYTETDFVQEGDNVILDYEASSEGVKIEALTSSGEMLTVGASPLKAFDDNLLGMALGETREFDLLVPENGLPSLAGKTIQVKATLVMGSKTTPCPLDDSLAEKLGKPSFQELREHVAGTAMATVKGRFKNAVNEAVANRLIHDNRIDVPNWMSLSEAQYLVHQAKMSWDTLADVDKEKYLEMAEKNVKLSLVLDKVREEHPEAQLTDQEVFDVLKSNLAKTKVPQSIDEVIQQMNKTGYLQILFSRIRDEHAMDYITKTVKVIE